MANLKDIRKRIHSVKNTRQITRAMKMVASAKLRRSQEAILNARPYAYRIYTILLTLAEQIGVAHPLLKSRDEKNIRVIVLAGDRGLCGSFNANVLKEGFRFIKQKEAEGLKVSIDCIGRKSAEFFKKRREISGYYEGLLSKAEYTRCAAIANDILKDYTSENLDAVYLVYNEFKSAIQQKVIVEKLLPISTQIPDGVVGMMKNGAEFKMKDYLYEPSQVEILDEIIPRHFQVQFFRSVLESVASEHGARMSAMDSASKNASEMIDALTLDYNKARQAAITKELMEIVGGVEAMR
jgi:F-type H+-transporting ATPase subunit gamma